MLLSWLTRSRASVLQPRRRTRRTSRLGLECLEDRSVPAWAVSPLASFAGEVTVPHEPDWLQMQVQTSSHRVLLTFESNPADGSAFEPGRLTIFAGEGAHAGTRLANGPGYALRGVSSGTFFARTAAADGTTGAFDVAVGLAGDVNGDLQVDARDIDAIRGLRGTRVGDDGFMPAADVNHNGMIGLLDLRLARHNFGATANVGPLTADQFLFAGSDALKGEPRVISTVSLPKISLVIPAMLNGAPITLDSFSLGVAIPPGAFQAVAGTLDFTKKMDAASPLFFDGVVKGTVQPTVTLDVGRRYGTTTFPFLRWDLELVVPRNYQATGSGANPAHLEEAVSLMFVRFAVTVYPILPNGKPGDPITRGWDFQMNTAWTPPGG